MKYKTELITDKNKVIAKNVDAGTFMQVTEQGEYFNHILLKLHSMVIDLTNNNYWLREEEEIDSVIGECNIEVRILSPGEIIKIQIK